MEGDSLPKPNYQFEKRQRELAKRQKQEEKRRQKLAGKTASDGIDDVSAPLPEDNSPVLPDGALPGAETA